MGNGNDNPSGRRGAHAANEEETNAEERPIYTNTSTSTTTTCTANVFRRLEPASR